MNKFLLSTAMGVVLATSSVATAQDPPRLDRTVPDSIAGLTLSSPITLSSFSKQRISPALQSATGPQELVVRLVEDSVGEAKAKGKRRGALKKQRQKVKDQQADFLGTVAGKAKMLGSANTAINAVMIEIDASEIDAIAANPMVASINPVVHYEMDLSETVPYIGGTAAQAMGFDGTGVSIAVLDSGIDYTHANLGGGGTLADYAAAYDDPTSRDGLFPTAKVVEGFDFVGESWPFGPRTEDDDPIDFEGHGTHVADISGGLGGVAPGSSLYAVKVCSAVASSCNGIALIKGMDYVLDPDGDPETDDAVDIVNMSLGSNYGHADYDDLSYAVEVASANGVLTVSSAGNGGDKPYKTGTPSAAPSALAVAQTQVPSAFKPFMTIVAPPEVAGEYDAVFQPWSVPLAAIVEANVIYGDTDGNNANGCDPFDGDLSGYIVLVDRGACSFSVKITNIGDAGGVIGIIATLNNDPPFPGGFGGGNPTIPGYMISTASGDALKFGLPGIGSPGDTIARFDPANGIALVGTVVSSSSRGPSLAGSIIKPEIGAPGASVSAEAGTGTGETPFGGTSGASPMVAGSAALVMDAYPDRNWAEVRAVLVNTAETEIYTEPGSPLAPISRIGGGEVRVDRAVESPIAVWSSDDLSPTLSYGFMSVYKDVTVVRELTVRNYSDKKVRLTPAAEFRYASDDIGAISFNLPGTVNLKAGQTKKVNVVMNIDASALPPWPFNSGTQGGNPDALTAAEFDGYITFSQNGESDPVHVPWHVMPRKSGNVKTPNGVFPVTIGNFGLPSAQTTLDNSGHNAVDVEVFSLLMTDPDDVTPGGPGEQNPGADLAAVGFASFSVPAGFCSGNESYLLQFATSSYDPMTHAVAPIYNSVVLDIGDDGTFDYEVFNIDLSFLGPSFDLSDGRNVTVVQDLVTGGATAFFFADHASNSANVVNTICAEQIGLNAANTGIRISGYAYAADLYYGSGINDTTDIFSFDLGLDRYLGIIDGDLGSIGFGTVPAHSISSLEVIDFGDAGTTESGVLLRYSHNPDGAEFDTLLIGK